MKYSFFFICAMFFTYEGYSQINLNTLKGSAFNNITLEVSLKPFKRNDKLFIREVAKEMFTQWKSLLRHADTVSIMLWTADGSEILDYRGNFDQPLEWAKYIGNPNTNHEIGSGPKELSLHERAYLYIENPPMFNYGDLKFIIQTLKEIGNEITGKPVRIGATFDPGPEFAQSDFKYRRHTEILGGNAMGPGTFVSCYSVLNADSIHYAGFPDGIPANTPFGTFFGRQSQHFLRDLDYDYLWLSNGFGFGVEGWSSTGAIFNGKSFDNEKLLEVRKKILGFWGLFRAECPEFRVETRGTNLSTAIDLARDGVDLKDIYKGHYNVLPPPNSPWAAINGDFGLELVGYMSRMADLPDERFLFRYYTHDPWWVNSPWLDRYGREPHDIYLPMSVSRMNENGEVRNPTHLNFLTIDDSYGNMPAEVPDEVIPHILKARYDEPTAPGPLIWIYPFDEYNDWAYKQKGRLPEIYYGDWFIRQAINNGFPMNTIISTTSFQKAVKNHRNLFNESILVSVAPDAGSMLERALVKYVESGGKLIIYGPVDHSGSSFLKLLNLKNEKAIEGELQITSEFSNDLLTNSYPDKINHRALFSGGGIRTKIDDNNDNYTKVLVKMYRDGESRDVVWVRDKPEWSGGKVAYVRGTNSSSFQGGQLLKSDDPEKWFIGGLYLRYILTEFSLTYNIEKHDPSILNPIMTVSRHDNGFFFSGYVPNTTVRQFFRFPQGAPILNGYQTKLDKGSSSYSLSTAWHRECRFFVEQNEGVVSSKEMHSGEKGVRRRLQLTGLKNANVRIYPPDDVTEDGLRIYLNAAYPWKTGQIAFKLGEKKYGTNYIVENVSGELVVAW